MKKELTDRQKEILTYIHQFREENGYPPTLREIGREFQISSTFGVKRHLDALAKKGYLSIESNASRGISWLDESATDAVESLKTVEEITRIPIVGRVAAGLPIQAIENVEGSLIVDSSFVKKSQNCFALKVKGDSMINAGIYEGDFVIVNPQNSASNDEIVVGLLGDEATVKRYYNRNSKIILIPENDNYPEIDVTGREDFQLVGKVVGIIRWFN